LLLFCLSITIATMRLLHFDQSGKLVLTDFRGKAIPLYAILSHTWGDAEVLFEDLGSGAYKEKDGYRKIEFCAAQAARDQLQYFWVDTCCIDKWNRRELSNAINSMFCWYRAAARCYVYLSDVSVSTAAETHQQSDWEAAFRASRWFTRGWTLQELVAPRSVEFFSREGQRIGDKASLEQLVHEITSIPHTALQNYPLDDFSITERKRWAAKRETREEEDLVYCLLGILDISMPVSYGEGGERALGRLQAEEEAASLAPSIIPYFRNDQFVGRESQLIDLEAQLFRNKQTTTTAIVGPGGTGKSQLALELVYRVRQANKSCSVFWVDAGDMDSLHQGYASIAQKLGFPGWDSERADVKALVKQHLSAKEAGQWLLVLDGADDISLGPTGSSAAQTTSLLDWLPRSELCAIVFTTTSPDATERLALQNIVELEALAPDTAQTMLENYLGAPVPESEEHEAKLLLKELSYLPLAIVQAAAYINARGSTLQEYRSQLDAQTEQALKHSSHLCGNALHMYGTRNLVAMTLFISMDWIHRSNVIAAECLFLAASVDRKDIPLNLLKASSDREKEDVVRFLSQYALITRHPADSALDLHRLVHDALREWLERQEWLDLWTHHAITQLVSVFPDGDHDNRSKWRRLLPHAKYVLSHSREEGEGGERLTLMWRCALALLSDGRYKEAEELEVQVMETRKRVLGEEHPDTLAIMANLASTFWNQGRWKEAEDLEVQVMETSSRVLGEEHPDTLTSMANLASTYRNQGRWKEAEELEVQVIETSSRVLGAEHPDTLTSMANLASTYRNQGRWKEAEELEVQVIETRKRLLGEEHPSILTSMANMASTFWNQGRWKEAEELEVQVMEMSLRVLGEEHPSTLTSMANLASTYRNQGRWKEAEKLEVQVMEMRKRVLGEEHPDTLAIMANLASTFWNQGRWKEAEELEVQAMKTSSRVLGEEHPDTLTSMANLASTYRNQGRWKEAEELEVPVIETSSRVLGAEHPDTLTSMANLASTYRNQGRWKEAEELEVQVMETRKRVLGEEHPDMLTSMASLASTYRNQGRWKEAEELEVQVIEKSSRVLGEEHPNTLTIMANLASTFWNQGRWKEAEELEVQVMESRKRVLGEEHPDTLTSMANLASTYRNQGRWKEAEELEVQVMETRKMVLREEHPDTLTSMANLASTYRNQGRWKEAEELEVQVMESRKRVLGGEHPDTMTSMANLASTYRNQGRWKEAEELDVQVMESRKRVLGEEHPDTLTSMANLASTYMNRGRWKEAEELEVQVMEMRKRVLGEEHPDMLTSIANLASTYRNQGRWKEAEELEVQVMETRKRVLGEEHPDTLTSMANLAITLKFQNRNMEAFSLLEICLQLRKRILGGHHPDTESSLEVLAQWQLENIEIIA
jgi:putative hemolysin